MPRNTSPNPWNASKPAVLMEAWTLACAPRPARPQRRTEASKPAPVSTPKTSRWPVVLVMFCVAAIVIFPLV